MRPSRFSQIGALGAFLLNLVSIPFAYGPAPDVPLGRNPIVLGLFAMLFISTGLLIIPKIFKWDWRAKYFGSSAICMLSFSFFTIIPGMALCLYGNAPLAIDLIVAGGYIFAHFFWCKKFHTIYNHVYENEELRKVVYQEELDAVYYSRRGDKYLLDKFYEFSQVPSDRIFVLFIFLACLLIPVMGQAIELAGVPFPHVFLTVAAFPVSLMFSGLAVRSYLIFYRYPARIKRETGKEVYVDLVSACQALEKSAAKNLRETFRNF
jgi:hypothetical protein